MTQKYKILSLLFLATTINYLDRSTLGVLGPTLRDHVFHWSMADYGDITTAFQLAYSLGLFASGRLVDILGIKRGFALAVLIWSLSALSQAFIPVGFGLMGFVLARFFLGLGESGNFPSCIKTVAVWFPPNERAFATGIFNAGSNIGAILAPLLIPLVVSAEGEGWNKSFLFGFALSATWLILWLKIYPETKPSPVSKLKTSKGFKEWARLASRPQTWSFAVLKVTDAAWWFYLFWGGLFLSDKFGLKINELGLPMVVIYLMADVGSILGGWFSGFLMKKGYSALEARNRTLLGCALCILPVSLVSVCSSLPLCVLLIGLAAGSHQAWSANAYTVVSDFFPESEVATVVGIGGMIGSVTSMITSLILGHSLKAGDGSSYFFPFLVAGLIYVISLSVSRAIQKSVPTS